MKASTKRLLSILMSGIFLLGSFILIFVAISPAAESINEKRATLQEWEETLREKSEVVEVVRRLTTEFREELSGLQESVDMALPNEKELTDILNQLDGILRRSRPSLVSAGIDVEETSRVRSVDSENNIAFLNFTINIRGRYSSVKEFIRLLETNIRIFEVKDFRILSIDTPITFEDLARLDGDLSNEGLGELFEQEILDDFQGDEIIVDPIMEIVISARAFFQED